MKALDQTIKILGCLKVLARLLFGVEDTSGKKIKLHMARQIICYRYYLRDIAETLYVIVYL